MSMVYKLLVLAYSLTILGPGAFATAGPNVLETVEISRIHNDWGLEELAGPGVAKIAVEDCSKLGYVGLAWVEGREPVRVAVVDCQQRAHLPCCRLSKHGLVADVNWPELNHKMAVLVLWNDYP